MPRTTVIRIHNEYLKFSAAHFTIFSATERERLHGHNFAVSAEITAEVGDNGLCFDYNIMKRRLRGLCDQLDEYTLIAADSPHLAVETRDGTHYITFDGSTLQLPASDTLMLPLRNITAEELSLWLLEHMLGDELVEQHAISALTIVVASGPGQSGSTRWRSDVGLL